MAVTVQEIFAEDQLRKLWRGISIAVVTVCLNSVVVYAVLGECSEGDFLKRVRYVNTALVPSGLLTSHEAAKFCPRTCDDRNDTSVTKKVCSMMTS